MAKLNKIDNISYVNPCIHGDIQQSFHGLPIRCIVEGFITFYGINLSFQIRSRFWKYRHSPSHWTSSGIYLLMKASWHMDIECSFLCISIPTKLWRFQQLFQNSLINSAAFLSITVKIKPSSVYLENTLSSFPISTSSFSVPFSFPNFSLWISLFLFQCRSTVYSVVSSHWYWYKLYASQNPRVYKFKTSTTIIFLLLESHFWTVLDDAYRKQDQILSCVRYWVICRTIFLKESY